jgi:hypothetical protein
MAYKQRIGDYEVERDANLTWYVRIAGTDDSLEAGYNTKDQAIAAVTRLQLADERRKDYTSEFPLPKGAKGTGAGKHYNQAAEQLAELAHFMTRLSTEISSLRFCEQVMDETWGITPAQKQAQLNEAVRRVLKVWDKS